MNKRYKQWLNEEDNLNVLVIIFGPTGAGKTTIREFFTTKGWNVIKSYTTRQRRNSNEEEYTFVSPEEWYKLYKNNQLMNVNKYQDNWYGINKSELERKGRATVISDVTSVEKLQNEASNMGKEVHILYIAPASSEEMEKRHINRGTPERIDIAKAEMEQAQAVKHLNNFHTVHNQADLLDLEARISNNAEGEYAGY